MLKMVDGTGIIGVDMICPLGVSTPQPPNYDRVELEGAGMLVLPNSLDAPLERLELGGKTKQNQDPPPSPEYLQEIKNSGKWNEGTQKYEVDVKVTGKNLLNLQKASEKVNWTQHSNFPGYYNFPVFVGRGNTVTISIPQKIPTGQGLFLSVCLTESGVREGWIAHSSNDSLNNTKLTYKTTNDYIYLNAHSDTIAGMKKYFGNLQVEYGNVATPYQPYKEQTLTLTSDRPITKWDRLVEQGGQIGWLYNTDKYIVTGQESFETKPSYVMEETVDFAFMNNKQSGIRKAADNFCNRLTYVDSVWSKHDVGFGISGVEVHIRLPLEAIGASSSDESAVIKTKFSEYLKKKYDGGGPFVFYHKSKTTEFVPLPQSEQNAIRALKTYYPTTVITVDGGELDPDIKVTYRKEI